ncbi:hypothetical protein QYF36_010246 [Acer negundo]|nr:hypothetical protein QYF36_010246 [Acer negundo]
MQTRRSSKQAADVGDAGPAETGGSEWEFEAEFANVIEESVNRGVNPAKPNQFYGENRAGVWKRKLLSHHHISSSSSSNLAAAAATTNQNHQPPPP